MNTTAHYSYIPATKDLMALVDQDPVTGCWIWKGEYNGGYGYGAFRIGDRKVTAHRVMYMSIFGALEKKQFVCHKCDVAACVNPLHMFVGTQKENMQDCRRKNRHYRGALTKCKHGHDFTPENTRVNVDKYGDPHRTCLTCERERQRLEWHRNPMKRARQNEARRRRREAARSQIPTPAEPR